MQFKNKKVLYIKLPYKISFFDINSRINILNFAKGVEDVKDD